MEQRRFDDLTRRLSANNSRRTVIKGLLAGAVTGVAGLIGGGEALAAKGGGGNHKPDCCPSTAPRLCGTECVDFTSDTNHCGACGVVCGPNHVCQNGRCVSSCPPGQTLCSGNCVDVTGDASNCGGCGTQCPEGDACVNGECQTTSCDDGNPCTSDTFDPTTGKCVSAPAPNGTPCSTGTGSGVCSAGVCVAGAECAPGTTQACYSGPDGTEGVGVCQAGMATCQPDGRWGDCLGEVTPSPEVCNNLDDDCDGQVDDGFDLENDPNNCGTCGHQCEVVNGIAGCRNGTCVVAACNPGWADCDGDPSNGCETNTAANPLNCGSCGVVCPSGTTCVDSVCQ